MEKLDYEDLLKMNLKTTTGFSLVELIFVIVIVGILVAISVPTYQKYVRRSLAAEGKALVGAVVAAERIYYSEYQTYNPIPAGNNCDPNGYCGVDSRANKYFKTYGFDVTAAAAFTVQTDADPSTDAAGLSVKGSGDSSNAVVVTVFDNGVLTKY